MCFRVNSNIQIPAVTFMKRETFFCAVSDIILYSFVKSFCQFGDAFTLASFPAVNTST